MKNYTTLILSILLFSCAVEGEKESKGSFVTPELHYVEAQYYPSEVTSYFQAPGQYIDNYLIANNIEKLLGPPKGGGTYSPDNSSIASLGEAGGNIVVKFEPPILNHPDNIGGYDFIVFGNSFWSGGPSYPQAEPGFIEVMQDTNQNNLPDDTWYILMPSDKKQFIEKVNITYSETVRTWKSKAGFNYKIALCEVTPTLKLGDMSGADGNNDNKLDNTEDLPDIDPVYFYTTPDTPGDLKIDPGSGGGDAFDISWALDINNLETVTLAEISWIKITTGKLADGASTEIDAITRVRRK